MGITIEHKFLNHLRKISFVQESVSDHSELKYIIIKKSVHLYM